MLKFASMLDVNNFFILDQVGTMDFLILLIYI